MKIQESAEHYLETLLILKERNGLVRSIDLANELGYSRPSVSVAVKQFRENGYVTVDEAGYIELTGTGREIAEQPCRACLSVWACLRQRRCGMPAA